MYVHTFWAVVTINILVCACYQNTEVSPHTHISTPQRQLSSTACKEDCFLGRLWLSQVRHCLAIYDQLAKGLAIMSVTYAVFVHGPWWCGFFWNNQAMCQVMVQTNVQQAIVHRIMEKNILIYTFFTYITSTNLKSLKIDRFIGLFMVSRQNNAQLTVYIWMQSKKVTHYVFHDRYIATYIVLVLLLLLNQSSSILFITCQLKSPYKTHTRFCNIVVRFCKIE